MSPGGGCEAAVIARARCGCAKLGECGKLLYIKFYLEQKGAVTRANNYAWK